MPPLAALLTPWTIIQILVSLFLAILFLQSGLDKVIDWRGNLEFHRSHFANTPLAPTVVLTLVMITIIELIAGTLSALGCAMIVLRGHGALAFWGAVAAGVNLTMLFFGQRVAKDYGSAATLVPYFILTLIAIAVLGHPMM